MQLNIPSTRRFKALIVAGIASIALLGNAHATDLDRQSELKRHTDNTNRLGKVAPYMKPKVAAIISDLEGHGDRPLIDGLVWRSPAQQVKLKREGKSKVSYSFHTVTDLDSKGKRTKPASLAVDITDKRYGWNSGNGFWLRLASAAEAHGVSTGIRWGLPTSDRQKISKAIKARDFKAPIRRGWDPAHVEPSGATITLSQAKAGWRPR